MIMCSCLVSFSLGAGRKMAFEKKVNKRSDPRIKIINICTSINRKDMQLLLSNGKTTTKPFKIHNFAFYQ